MKLVLVSPMHVKRTKELDGNDPSKSDRKDPKTIAKLVLEVRYVTSLFGRQVSSTPEHPFNGNGAAKEPAFS